VLRDNDADGRVDRVVATYSESLAASTDAGLWSLGGAIPSSGTQGTVSTAGAVATLLINEGAGAPDTAVGTLTVALANGTTGIKDATGNQAASFAATAPADGATPIRTSMVMQDANGNGKIDRVVVGFSEPLVTSTDATVWTLANVPSAGAKSTVSTSGATATVLITEGAGAADTGVGAFTVTLAAGGTGIRDAAGNQSSFAATAPTDGAIPQLVSLAVRDNDTNGKIDRVVATYSETLATSTDNTLWTLGGAIPSGGTKGALTTSGTAATLLIAEGAGAADTTVGTLTVALANSAAGIKDATGNLAPSFGATAPADAAAPVRLSLVMQDSNSNGKIDRVVSTYSETLASSTDATVWTLANVPSAGTKSTVSTSGATATLLITEGGGGADTGVGSFTVALAAGAAGIRDAAGNQSSFAATAPTDAALPILQSLVLRDNDANGKVDRVVATYSETLASSTDNALWTLGGAIPSGGTKGALSTSGGTATLLITEGAGTVDTAVGTLTVALANGVTGIKDATGNQAASFGAVAPADGAIPIRQSLLMQDSNTNGKVDRVVATYSESLATSTDATLWTLANIPSTGTKGTVSTSGATATLLITEGAGTATTAVGSFTVALTAGATGIRDAAGNQAAAFAATAPTDDADPVLLTLDLRDADTDGRVDQVVAGFTETLASSTDAASWTVAGTIPSAGTKGTLSTSGATATLVINEGAGAPDTTIGSMTLALAASATGIRDAAGNQSSFAARAPTDDASPVTVSVAVANGGVAGTVANGDTITVVYSEPVATLCTAWGTNSLTANQGPTSVTGNFNNGSPDTFTVSTCAGFGTLSLPGTSWVSGNRTIATSASWTLSTRTLVLTFTAAPSGGAVNNQTGTKTYSVGTLSDAAANSIGGAAPAVGGAGF
jgi:hypothetical protein